MKRLIISLAAIAALASCIYEEGQAPEELIDVTISAGIDTKTVMSGESVKWEAGDKVSLVFKSSSDAFVGEFSTAIDNGTIEGPATFMGGVGTHVTAENGYADDGFIVYPSTAVDAQTGEVTFLLPSDQYAKADGSGSFEQHLNLSSSVVSLADIKADQHAEAKFRNALSVLKFNLSSDVESVVISAAKPLAGKPAAMRISDDKDTPGRLLVDGAVWDEPSASVTLYPENRGATFKNNVTYSVLIWPGKHSTLTVRVNFKDYSSYEKTLNQDIVFEPSKYYSLTLAGKDMVINHIDGRLDKVEGSLADIDDRLDDVEGTQSSVDDILKQIQSVSLMSEYLDNSAYASFAKYMNSLDKLDIELDYLIRPESVAKALVDAIDAGKVSASDVFKGLLYYREDDGTIDFDTAATELAVTGVSLVEDVLTVSISAAALPDRFYEGGVVAELALEISTESEKTHLVSDFAKLVPMSSSGIRGNYIKNVPVPGGGVDVIIPFTFTSAAAEYEIRAVGTNTTRTSVSYYKDYKNGSLVVGINPSVAVANQSVELTIVSGEQVLATETFTFVEAGTLTLNVDGPADYIGGDVIVTVEHNDFQDGFLNIANANGTGVVQSGSVFTFGENTDAATRTATALYSIMNSSLTYNKYIDISQYGTSTPLQRNYYANGFKKILNKATYNSRYPLNLVILGDGYMQKDLREGGKFERMATSAAEIFFSVEPFKSFKNRFDVYMVTFASAQEGTTITSSNIKKNTYFESVFAGGDNTQALSNKDKIVSVVKNQVGLSLDQEFYRTVVLLLVNTNENGGSTDYVGQTTIDKSVVGDGYASFAVATLAAHSTATNGLIKHETGGHGFGRLGDEYAQGWYTPTIINDKHAVGFYLNVATEPGYWDRFTYEGGYSEAEVGYYPYMDGLYRSTDMMGIMWNNNGSFNAVSRWVIYDRIRKQTEGYNDYWYDFLEYDDQKNR